MYVGVHYDRTRNKVLTREIKDGVTVQAEYQPEYFFYVEDKNGRYVSTTDVPLSRLTYADNQTFQNGVRKYKNKGIRTYEADVKVLFKTLEKHFEPTKIPKFNKQYFDIEVAFDKVKGYADPSDPFNPVTAISIYNNWENTLYSLVIPPKHISLGEAEKMLEHLPNNLVCENETQMFSLFFELTKDAHIFAGWNCMPLTNNIWGKDAIYKFGDIPDQLVNSMVVNKSPITKKRKFGLVLRDGTEVFSSADHKYDCYVIDPEYYTDLTIRPTQTTVAARRIFVEYELDKFAKSVSIQKIQDMCGIHLEYANTLYHLFMRELNSGTLMKFYNKSPKNSGSPEHGVYTVTEINDLIVSGKTVFVDRLVNQNTNTDSSDYTDTQLYLAGLLYTDGSIKEYSYTFYQSDIEMMNEIHKMVKYQNTIQGPYKNNYALNIHTRHLGKAHELFTVGHKKKLDIHKLSKLSKRQFMMFLSGLLDGDGYYTDGMICYCNFDGEIQNIAELCRWNGIHVGHCGATHISMPTLDPSDLSVIKVKRFGSNEKSELKENYLVKKTTKAKAKQIIYRNVGDNVYRVAVKKVVEYDEEVDMMDIQTDTNRFVSSGVITHNCTYFDLPYMVNRVRKIMGNDATKNFCLWGYTPVPKTVEKYGKEQQVYDLIGKVHLDMLELYQKYTYSEQPSYSLDYIASIEVGEKKVPYTGSLDQLYNEDFVKFVEYSRQDTQLLEKIDMKRDHINLAFTIAYENLVDIKTVMGSVALSDNAITIEAHRLGKIVPDRFGPKSEDKIPGAYVVNPKVGITSWVGQVDLTSLYPSIFRALNLGNETIVAQVKHTITAPIINERMANNVITDDGVKDKKEASFAEAWRDFVTTLEYTEIMNRTDTMLELEINEGETMSMSAKDLYEFVFSNGFILTANATIIRTDKKSVVSSLLERWFNERKLFQKRAGVYQKLTEGIALPDDILKKLEKK